MKLLYVLFLLLVLTGCSKPKTEENQLTADSEVDTVELASLTSSAPDSLSYVGYIQKFEDNSSFYTDLYFVDDFNYDLYNEVTKMGDQVIFTDEETKRTRIEIEKAQRYFNLTGLSDIAIYDSKNLKLTNGRLSHVEYVEDLIESRFVAVFEIENPNVSEYLFCIGNMKDDLPTINFSPYDDKKLESELIDYLKLNTDNIWSIVHYKLDNEIIYSTVSADTTALIIGTKDKTHRTLYKSNSSEAIGGLAMISKKINGRQILLTDCGMPETDMMWTSVLIFNGTEYETSKDHRIRN